MIIPDLSLIFSWWVVLFLLGTLSFPLTWYFFKRFFDAGYSFSKIVGILLLSYFVWLAGSLRILPFTTITIWTFVLLLALGNFAVAKKFKKEFFKKIKTCWKILVFEEILFFLLLSLWAFIRGFEPRIEGLEKFMDFGFINSAIRSQFFPPADMWMAGKSINYYYFGHFVAALLTKLSNIPSFITYNLMMATLAAISFTAGLSLTANFFHFNLLKWRRKAENVSLKSVFVAGTLSAFLLTFGANLHPLYFLLTHGGSTGYWYPDATRFIVEKFGAADNTIHEFPIYSFIVSDLHGHVSNIPFVLLFLALVFAFLVSAPKRNYKLSVIRFVPLLGLVLGTMYMTNSWDLPIYLGLFGLSLFSFFLFQEKKFYQAFVKTFIISLVVFALAIFFSLPFHLHFSPMTNGIDFVNAHSPFWQLLVLWGYQWLISICLLVFLGRKRKLCLSDIFILALIFWATVLIIIPEFFFLKDIYIASYHRANTMFKLTYQSFIMYALAAGYIVIQILTSTKSQITKIFFLVLCSSLLFFPLIYPIFGIRSYYGNLKNYQGLSRALDFLKTSAPDDFQAVLWLTKKISGQPVVLEAAGDSYTLFNRVSALTGLPTAQGWLVHEWLWRGSFDEPSKRAMDVKIIYETKNLSLATSLLEKYRVDYVFIGQKEAEKYQLEENKFQKLGELIFSSGNTRIYRLFPKDKK